MQILKRDAAIDSLRGFSILLVLATHGVVPNILPESAAKAVGHLWGNGFFGVTIFFVISGFLITSNTLARYGSHDRIENRDFYIRRFARIGPCLCLFLLLVVALHLLRFPSFVPNPDRLFWQGIVNATGFQYNWFYATGGYVPGTYALGPLWSLSIEEMFYVVLPIVCIFARTEKTLITVLLILIVAPAFYRRTSQDFYVIAGAADGLAFGCLVAIASRHLQTASVSMAGRAARYLGLAIILIILVVANAGKYHSFPVTAVAFGSALFLLGNSISKPVISLKLGAPLFVPLAFVGGLSYELYLFHMPVMLFIRDEFGVAASPWIVPAAVLAFSATIHFGFSEWTRKKLIALFSSHPLVQPSAKPSTDTPLNIAS